MGCWFRFFGTPEATAISFARVTCGGDVSDLHHRVVDLTAAGSLGEDTSAYLRYKNHGWIKEISLLSAAKEQFCAYTPVGHWVDLRKNFSETIICACFDIFDPQKLGKSPSTDG